MTQNQILSSVKDRELVEKRRNQIVKGGIALFKEKGFHRTTTREIAKESGFSIGTLYEYIRTKEDVLFLVCDAIYQKVKSHIDAAADLEDPSVEHLIYVIKSYFQLMDEMQEEIVIMYQEIKSLEKDTKESILQKEREMVSMLEQVIVASLPRPISKQDAELVANNIFIQGQMWGFRRWVLQKQFTLDEYIDRQTHYLLRALEIDGGKTSR